MEHPPVYRRPPAVTSLDYSPDGQLLAVSGFHEVFLLNADSGERIARLIGLSERVQSVRFSPDGNWLAVTGGMPGRMGELQVWKLADQALALSLPVTFDTVYGVSWSPDSAKVAFGASDNAVRVVEVATGEQLLRMASHDDWVLDSTFSADGSHVLSAGRDMTVKLTELATGRFVDNVTSITPGALKGGIQGIDRHPHLDQIVVGSADGIPKVYRMFRHTPRKIGDDANQIFELFPMPGRLFSVRFNHAGNRIVAGSSLDGQGAVTVCSYDYTADVPDGVKEVMTKIPGTRNDADRKLLADYRDRGTKLLARVEIPSSSVYAVALNPAGTQAAAAGTDGIVRLIDVATQKVVKEVISCPLEEPRSAVTAQAAQQNLNQATAVGPTVNKSATVATSDGVSADFINDVNPLLSRLGCNAGTCHGSAKGKNGFKLSLRGYDPIFDVRALTDDHAAPGSILPRPKTASCCSRPPARCPMKGERSSSRVTPTMRSCGTGLRMELG